MFLAKNLVAKIQQKADTRKHIGKKMLLKITN